MLGITNSLLKHSSLTFLLQAQNPFDPLPLSTSSAILSGISVSDTRDKGFRIPCDIWDLVS